jgi:hypothetical protein
MDAMGCRRYGGTWNKKTKTCNGLPVKQVNNLKIKYSNMYEKWQVITPDGRVWEEFRKRDSAIAWAKKTKDCI